MRHRLGFTLLELLVVVTVIAVLAAMLMPAIRTVRDAASKTQCLGHLRQNGLAVLSYLGDNRGWYPTARQDIYNANIFWFDHILPFVDAVERTGNGTLDAKDLVSGANVIKGCPAWKPSATDVIHGYVGYGFNGCLKMAGDKRRSWWNIQAGVNFYLDYNQRQITNLTQRTLIGDAPDWHLTVDNSKYATTWAPNRHRANANYLACDGHAAARYPDTARLAIADPTQVE
jgi:prepilin-type N-terminal cleavage/methylation domain-containing protein/prepilin-type processing-associated H-X9-DG protein